VRFPSELRSAPCDRVVNADSRGATSLGLLRLFMRSILGRATTLNLPRPAGGPNLSHLLPPCFPMASAKSGPPCSCRKLLMHFEILERAKGFEPSTPTWQGSGNLFARNYSSSLLFEESSDSDNQALAAGFPGLGLQSSFAGDAVNVQFMVKDAKRYAASGGWGFADFTNGKPGNEALQATRPQRIAITSSLAMHLRPD
jgi:hypothetical protein